MLLLYGNGIFFYTEVVFRVVMSIGNKKAYIAFS
jgi:hypothetical protein